MDIISIKSGLRIILNNYIFRPDTKAVRESLFYDVSDHFEKFKLGDIKFNIVSDFSNNTILLEGIREIDKLALMELFNQDI